MTLHTPGVVWPWPADDPVIPLSDLILDEWKHVGDSHIWRAHLADIDSEPLWLCKVGRDAVAERLTYLIAREIDLPFQHVFWGSLGNNPIAAIRIIPHACPMKSIQHDSDNTPYVIYNGQHIKLRNNRDRIGFQALQILFSDLDGGESLVDAANGIIVRIDSASGHGWATQALLPAPDEGFRLIMELIQKQNKQATDLEWPGETEVLAGFRSFTEQAQDSLRRGPNVDSAVRTITGATFITHEQRHVMLHTLKALLNMKDLPQKVSDAFRIAPSLDARSLANDMEVGLTNMCRSLADHLPRDLNEA